MKMFTYNCAVLKNGASVISACAYGFRFSDGSECAGNPELAEKFATKRQVEKVREIRGMPVNRVGFVLSKAQLNLLNDLCGKFDIVIVLFPLLATLRGMGVRDRFPNVVTINYTEDTKDGVLPYRVVDINNWSY